MIRKLSAKAKALLLASSLLLAAPMSAQAAATFVNPAAAGGSASANVNFRVVVNKVLFLGIGTGYNAFTPNATEELIEWQVVPGLTATGLLGATAGGDAGVGSVNVRLFGNGGSISLQAVTPATGLANGSGQFIDFADIDTVSNNATLSAPTLVNGASASVAIPGSGSGNQIVNESAIWTYSFNYVDGTLAAGTYNGTATYTASLP